jgi:hypothetical protein
MALVAPRLTDHYGIQKPQASLSFAIPLLDQDIPLYVDPFLLWKSPSLQDKALHGAILNAFNHLGYQHARGDTAVATQILTQASECEEVGLGVSSRRRGSRIGEAQALQVLELFSRIPRYKHGFQHIEEIQLFVSGLAKDRISDIACSLIKSFLIDYTISEAEKLGLPMEACEISDVYDPDKHKFQPVRTKLPLNPLTSRPLLFAPKRWLRFTPWLNFDDYYKDYCPKDTNGRPVAGEDRVEVLAYNRDNYGIVEEYITAKELTSADCRNDPLFSQIPLTSAKWRLRDILKLPSGNKNGADKAYENAACQLLASLLYPDLDFAAEQSRTDDNTLIRDLLFYNTASDPFLQELGKDYGCRQIPFELKNVAALQREHVGQLNRYMTDDFGRFGVFVTRNETPAAIRKNLLGLWAGQRRCIITLVDNDLAQMVELYETKQRKPIDVLKKKYVEFRRSCPS